jgi:3-oxoadipate enol-lactonase
MTELRPLRLGGPAGLLGGWTLGDLDAGIPVLFCHPINGEGRMWAPVAERLDGRPALLPDLRGHGSARPDGPYSLDAWVDDLTAVIDHVGASEVHVVGGSLGGAMAVELAARAPDRVRSIASFGGTLHVRDDATQFRALLDEHGVAGTFRLLVPELSVGPNASPEVVEHVLSLCNRNEPAVVADILDTAMTIDVRDRAALVRCPALVACGEHDRTCPPAHSHEMAELLGVSAVVMEGLGHLPMIEAPQATTQLIAAHLAAAES